jgi:hypothetical protein
VIERIPDRLERTLRDTLGRGERVFVKLRGAFKEALICTDSRVIILKGGWMTGQMFGTDTFQCPYANIAGVEVKFHLLTGYYEVNAGGMQSSAKSFWNTDRRVNAAKALNCVSLSGRQQANRFRQACAFIMARAGEGRYRTSGRRRIKRGDRVAALGCGIGVVEQVNEKEAHVVLSRLVLRISRRDIIWDEANMRWEAIHSGVSRTDRAG